MLQMRTAARIRPRAADSSELSSFRTQTLGRKHYLPRDPRLGGLLLALCDLAVFAAVLALVAMLLAPGSGPLFLTSWPHFAITSILSFIVAHSMARSYDLDGAVHASLFDFVIKPAILTCVATTFSYIVETSIGRSEIGGRRRDRRWPSFAGALRDPVRHPRDGGRAAAGLRVGQPLAGRRPLLDQRGGVRRRRDRPAAGQGRARGICGFGRNRRHLRRSGPARAEPRAGYRGRRRP